MKKQNGYTEKHKEAQDAIMTARASVIIAISTTRASTASRVRLLTASVHRVLLASLVAQVRGIFFYDLSVSAACMEDQV